MACDSASNTRLQGYRLQNKAFNFDEAANNILNTFHIKIEKRVHRSSAHVPRKPTMPLVVPGLMSSSGSNNNNQQEDWMNKLVGKKLTDSTSDTTVRFSAVE